MNKRKLHHWWRRIRQIKTYVIVILIVVFSVISVYQLRQNNLKMVELRQEVLEVDKANGDVDKALRDLGNHVVNHMNTRMSQPIELIHSFNRAAEEARADAEVSTNSDIYDQAKDACEDPSIPLTARAQCFQDYITNNTPPGENPQPLELPSKDLFRYSFASPAWSPDFAGFSIIITIVLVIALIARISAAYIIKRMLK